MLRRLYKIQIYYVLFGWTLNHISFARRLTLKLHYWEHLTFKISLKPNGFIIRCYYIKNE